MLGSMRRSTLVIVLACLTACAPFADEPTPEASVRVEEVSATVDCTRTNYSCDVEAFVTVVNEGEAEARIGYCKVSADGPVEDGGVVRPYPLVVQPGEAAIGRVEFYLVTSTSFTKSEIEGIQSWDARCMEETPEREPAADQPLYLAEWDCAWPFFAYGPVKLASNYDIGTFDPEAAAAVWNELGGVFYRAPHDEEAIQACVASFRRSFRVYEKASRQGWPPYGDEGHWLQAKYDHFTCAVLVADDVPGPDVGELVRRGELTLREAARRYARQSYRRGLAPEHRLVKPGFDGCLGGLRRGLSAKSGG